MMSARSSPRIDLTSAAEWRRPRVRAHAFMKQPLRGLRGGNPRRGEVLHQRRPRARSPGHRIDSLGAAPAQPSFQVFEQGPQVAARAEFGDRILSGVSILNGKLSGSAISRRRLPSAGLPTRRTAAPPAPYDGYGQPSRGGSPDAPPIPCRRGWQPPPDGLTSSSRLGSAVAIPPIGTAPWRRHTATRRRNRLVKNGVVLISTSKRSGQTPPDWSSHTRSGSPSGPIARR